MLNCFIKLKGVVFFVSLLACLPSFSAENADNRQHIVKVLSQELWNKGILNESETPIEKSNSKNVIYFPEELEIALRLIDS